MKSGVRKNILILLVFCIIAVWLFGIFFMHKIDDHGSSGCFAAVANNTDCPQTMSVLGYIAFHANIFHIFSDSVPADSLVALFLFLLFTLLAVCVFIQSPPAFFSAFLQRRDIIRSIVPSYFLQWFAFHEKRDPLVIYHS